MQTPFGIIRAILLAFAGIILIAMAFKLILRWLDRK